MSGRNESPCPKRVALLLASLLAFGGALGCDFFLRGGDGNGAGNGTGNGGGNGNGTGNGGGNGNGEMVCPGDPDCPPESYTIHDVRDPIRRAALPDGELTLEGLVVTAVRTRPIGGVPHYDAYVQDPAGGPWSAIELAALEEAPSPGDVLTVTGTYADYFGQDRLVGVDYAITGTADLPEPEVFHPAEIATGGDEAHPWQGALVRVQDVTVTDDRVLGTDGVWRGDFQVTGDLVVGRFFPHDYVPVSGDTLLSITGVLHYSFSESRLQPRSNEDLVLEDGEPSGLEPISIYEVRAYDGELPADGRLVRIEDVVITAISVPDNRGRRNLFVQEAAGGAESGVYLFNQPDFDVSAHAVGDRVSLEGRHTRHALPGDTVTHDQITLRALERLGPGTPLEPVVVDDPADLIDPEKGADAWVGVLLTIAEVTATAEPNQYGEVMLGAGAPKLAPVLMGRDVLEGTEAGDHFASVTGILQWRFGYALLPRSADDLVAGEAPEPPEPEVVAISDVRDPEKRADLGPGPYTVEGIVTALRPRSGRHDVFIQAHEAGPYDAILLPFVSPAPAPGDRIRATGQYEDFFGYDRLASATYEVLESGLPAPEPIVVAPATIATGSADAFAHQSLLLRVEDVTVVDDRVLGTDGNWRGDFEVDDGLYVGRWFGHGYDAEEGDTFASITGVLAYSFDDYYLQPRSSADLVFSEGDGPPDPDPEPEPLIVTLPQLQDETHPDHPGLNTWVEVSEAVVTGVRVGTRPDLTTYVDGFTIQTPGTSGPHHGIFVYTPSKPPPEDVQIQDRFRVRGEFTSFLNMPQIQADEIEHLGVADALPAAHLLTDPAIFDDPPAIRPWLGVLVRVEKPADDLVVTDGTDAYGEYRVDGVMRVRDFLHDHATAPGDTFSALTGVVGYFETFSGQVPGFRLWPRVADDLETP